MKKPIVFVDFAGGDDESLMRFYESVCGWEPDSDGKFSVPVSSPIHCAIRCDPAEKRVYIGVDDVTAALKLVVQSGGSIDKRRFEVPGVVILGLFRDPAGNPMGFIELDGNKPRIP